jgi:P27 family predicted phage terminase small subunit
MGGRGSGGKNKKPTALKELEGNQGHRPLNAREPKPEDGEPPMPADLPKKVQLEWKRLVPLLKAMKVLTTADGDALEALCRMRLRWRQAEDLIDRTGQVVAEKISKPDGTRIVRVKKNPAVTVSSDALRHYRALLADFGLTPASRSGIHAEGGNDRPSDPLDDLLGNEDSDEIVQ